jgi:hypothetical protein
MSGWRDEDGRTAADRQQAQHASDRAHFFDTLRNRPLSFVKPVLGLVFVAVLVFALITAYG